MRVFLKNLFRIAGGAIAIGLILGVIAFNMDNKVYADWNRVNFNLINGWFHLEEEDYYDNQNNEYDEYKDSDNAGVSNQDTISSEDNYIDDGVSGYPITYENVTELEFHMLAGKLQIREGETFTINVNEKGKERISSEVKDGRWIIKENNTSGSSESISVFGIDINVNGTVSNNDIVEVYITLPEGFVAEELDLSVEAGLINADMLAAANGKINVGAGSINIEELSIDKESSYKVAAGMMKISNAKIHNANIDCSVGSINLEGIITGESKINSALGYIDLDLEGDEEDYDYFVNCKLGTLSLNGERYSGINTQISQNNKADNHMTLTCDLGSITMNID